MKKTLLATAVLALCSTGLWAVENETSKLDVAFDVRADFTWENPEGPANNHSGIHGRYLNLMVNGDITPQLSYSWRQRMNKFSDLGNDVFSATDWVYLRWKPLRNLAVSAGKQVVMVGGYEYDAAPIDVFFASQFWNNFACYQFGASATYISNDGRHELSFQVTNSPYQRIGSSCYAWNVYWLGRMGAFETMWSVNMMEYERGKYVNFIALGNRLHLGPVDIQLDLMNRYAGHGAFIGGDFSVIAKIDYAIRPWMTVTVKGGYDEFKKMPGAPEHLDNPFYGGGFEFYPLRKLGRNLRLHAIVDRAPVFTEGPDANLMTTQVNIGLKWKVNLFRLR